MASLRNKKFSLIVHGGAWDIPQEFHQAVVRDKYGNLAVATSTGGTPHKLPGRVGDTPLVVAGAYADQRGLWHVGI